MLEIEGSIEISKLIFATRPSVKDPGEVNIIIPVKANGIVTNPKYPGRFFLNVQVSEMPEGHRQHSTHSLKQKWDKEKYNAEKEKGNYPPTLAYLKPYTPTEPQQDATASNDVPDDLPF